MYEHPDRKRITPCFQSGLVSVIVGRSRFFSSFRTDHFDEPLQHLQGGEKGLVKAHIFCRGMGDVRCPTERIRSALPFQILASELRPAARRDPTERRAAPLKGEQAVSLLQDRKSLTGEVDADFRICSSARSTGVPEHRRRAIATRSSQQAREPPPCLFHQFSQFGEIACS